MLGVLVGWLFPSVATHDWVKALGDGFVKLIKMVIAPIIFFTLTSGIAHISDARKVGRIGIKAIVYFEIVSTFALGIGLITGNVLRPGAGFSGGANGAAVATYAKQAGAENPVQFVLNIIPDSVVGAFARGDILQVLLFSILFGFALLALGERVKMLRALIEEAAQAVFGVITIVQRMRRSRCSARQEALFDNREEFACHIGLGKYFLLASVHAFWKQIAMTLVRTRVAALMVFSGLLFVPAAAGETTGSSAIWSIPDIGALPDDDHGRQVRFGRELIIATYAYIGPFVVDPTKRYAGNDLACANCHLKAGTKKFGLPIFGLYGDFPRYSARLGEEISIEDRINSCMTRSMNGRSLPNDAPEMQALVAYVKFLSSGVSPGEQLPGYGSGKMPDLDRAADPAHGKQVYARVCLACHNSDGSGIALRPEAMVLGYVVPPVWGNDSFNNGAGMARIITLANFIHFNMPPGAGYLNPVLSPAEAWDVAAYVESQARPQKSGLDRDYSSDLLDKPVDAPYGPYADRFTEEQHKYGPFGPIRAEIARLRAAKDKAPSGAK